MTTKLSLYDRKVLLNCIKYHELHAREPILTLNALSKDFKTMKGLKKLQQQARKEHLRYVEVIQKIL